MSKETQIEKAKQFLEEYDQLLKADDEAVFILNENSLMAELMELFITEQLCKNNFDVEIKKADGCNIKIIKGKENKQ